MLILVFFGEATISAISLRDEEQCMNAANLSGKALFTFFWRFSLGERSRDTCNTFTPVR